MFRKKKISERCSECSKFLSAEQLQVGMGICTDCAEKLVANIKRNLKIRAMIGLLLVSVVFIVIQHFRANFAPNAISELSVPILVIIALMCFLFPFFKYVKLEEIFESHSAVVVLEERLGFIIIESMFTVISGPFFFVSRLYQIRKLSKYINNQYY